MSKKSSVVATTAVLLQSQPSLSLYSPSGAYSLASAQGQFAVVRYSVQPELHSCSIYSVVSCRLLAHPRLLRHLRRLQLLRL